MLINKYFLLINFLISETCPFLNPTVTSCVISFIYLNERTKKFARYETSYPQTTELKIIEFNGHITICTYHILRPLKERRRKEQIMRKNREEEREEARLAEHISTPLPIILRCNTALIAGLFGEMKVLELLETDPRVLFLSSVRRRSHRSRSGHRREDESGRRSEWK